jgi:uncharacterized heparinase superfamily protein
MNTDFLHYDTAETIADHPAGIAAQASAEARYREFGDELAADARALLQTVRHVLTGREILQLEAAAGMSDEVSGIDVNLIGSLRIQFSREIGEAKNRPSK